MLCASALQLEGHLQKNAGAADQSSLGLGISQVLQGLE